MDLEGLIHHGREGVAVGAGGEAVDIMMDQEKERSCNRKGLKQDGTFKDMTLIYSLHPGPPSTALSPPNHPFKSCVYLFYIHIKCM